MTTQADAAPDVLTVEEVARILRIGRNSAYALARQWLATGGKEGLPAVRLGRNVRIPRPALEQLLGCELTVPDDGSEDSDNVLPIGRSRPAGTL
jgi:excisionase family DNA binding protein